MGWHEEEPGFVVMALTAVFAAVVLPWQYARGRLKRKLTLNETLWRSVFRR